MPDINDELKSKDDARAKRQTAAKKSEQDKLISSLYKKIAQQQDCTERVIEAISGSLKAIPVPSRAVTPRTPSKRISPETGIVLMSDEQIGEKVLSEETQGKAEYSWDIFLKRLSKFTKFITETALRHHPIQKALYVFRLGDHIEGELIYPGQQTAIDTLLVDQIVRGAYVEAVALSRISAYYKHLVLVCVTGNHGRIDKRASVRSNFDYLFNVLLASFLQSHTKKNVHIFLNKGKTGIIQVEGFNFALNHGDKIRGWMGIPFYGMARTANRLMGMHGLPIEAFCVGHHHQAAQLPGVLANGSWPGGSTFATDTMFTAAPPIQVMFGVHKEHGVIWNRHIHLEDRRPTLSPDEQGMLTAYEDASSLLKQPIT